MSRWGIWWDKNNFSRNLYYFKLFYFWHLTNYFSYTKAMLSPQYWMAYPTQWKMEVITKLLFILYHSITGEYSLVQCISHPFPLMNVFCCSDCGVWTNHTRFGFEMKHWTPFDFAHVSFYENTLWKPFEIKRLNLVQKTWKL